MITTEIAKLILQAKKQSALTFVRSYNIKTPLSHSAPAYPGENVFRGAPVQCERQPLIPKRGLF